MSEAFVHSCSIKWVFSKFREIHGKYLRLKPFATKVSGHFYSSCIHQKTLSNMFTFFVVVANSLSIYYAFFLESVLPIFYMFLTDLRCLYCEIFWATLLLDKIPVLQHQIAFTEAYSGLYQISILPKQWKFVTRTYFRIKSI